MAKTVGIAISALVLGLVGGYLLAGILAGGSGAEPCPTSVETDFVSTLGGRVLARVGEWTITEAEFRERWEEVLGPEARAFHRARGGPSDYLDQLVEEKLLTMEAIELGYLERRDIRVGLDLTRTTLTTRPLIADEVRRKAFPEERLRQAYEEMREDLERVPRLRARHIVVTPEAFPPGQTIRNSTGDDATDDEEVREKIAFLQEEIASGADFAELARKYSEDVTAPTGGDLGVFEPGQMLPEFEEKVFALEEGEISEPIETRMGVHLVQVTEKEPGGVPSFEDARSVVAERLLEKEPEAGTRRYQELVERLRREHPVEILASDRELLGFDLR